MGNIPPAAWQAQRHFFQSEVISRPLIIHINVGIARTAGIEKVNILERRDVLLSVANEFRLVCVVKYWVSFIFDD